MKTTPAMPEHSVAIKHLTMAANQFDCAAATTNDHKKAGEYLQESREIRASIATLQAQPAEVSDADVWELWLRVCAESDNLSTRVMIANFARALRPQSEHPDTARCIKARNDLNAALHGNGALIDDLEHAVANACAILKRRRSLAGDRADFEEWMSEGGKWPKAVERGQNGDYLLLQTATNWATWQACASLRPQAVPMTEVWFDGAMRLADAYADACFDQGLNQRTEDPNPEAKREKLVEHLHGITAPAGGEKQA